MNPLLLGGIAQGVGGLISGITGLFQRHKANQLLAQNPFPNYSIPKEVYENKNIAGQIAGQGLPSQQYEQAMRDIQRQQGTAISGLQGRRSAVGGIGKVVAAGNDASLNLEAKDAAQKIANQKVLMGANQQLAGYQDKAFDWNEKQKYLQNYSRAMSLLGAGGQNLTSGLSGIAAGGIMGAQGLGLFGGQQQGYNYNQYI